MKLYRNRDYQFSIEIPEYMEYITPRGPNVKMTAGIQGFNMNIIVKPSPYLEFSNDETLRELLAEQIKSYQGTNISLFEADIIDLPQFRVLYQGCIVTYKEPKTSFKMTLYMFQFIRHFKYYGISYFVALGKENLYQDTIINSISSFADETGWY